MTKVKRVAAPIQQSTLTHRDDMRCVPALKRGSLTRVSAETP